MNVHVCACVFYLLTIWHWINNVRQPKEIVTGYNVLGVSWTILTNNSKEGFSWFMLRILLADLWLLEGALSAHIGKYIYMCVYIYSLMLFPSPIASSTPFSGNGPFLFFLFCSYHVLPTPIWRFEDRSLCWKKVYKVSLSRSRLSYSNIIFCSYIYLSENFIVSFCFIAD